MNSENFKIIQLVDILKKDKDINFLIEKIKDKIEAEKKQLFQIENSLSSANANAEKIENTLALIEKIQLKYN